jgi:hypothetical protein
MILEMNLSDMERGAHGQDLQRARIKTCGADDSSNLYSFTIILTPND